MSGFMRAGLAASVVFFLAACGTVNVGQDFAVNVFEAKVERGISTRDQVRAWLGTPTSTGVSMDKDGERLEDWTYYHASGKLPDMSGAKVKFLQVTFDAQGIVRSYSWSASK